jgi:hypothetical protein
MGEWEKRRKGDEEKRRRDVKKRRKPLYAKYL